MQQKAVYNVVAIKLDGLMLPVLLRNSSPVTQQVKYVRYRATVSSSSSATLNGATLSVKNFLVFWEHTGFPKLVETEKEASGDKQAISAARLLGGFRDTLHRGDKDLGWPALRAQTVNIKLNHVSAFLDWLKVTDPDNPVATNRTLDKPMSPHENLMAYSRALKTSMLGYLYPHTSQGKTRMKKVREVSRLQTHELDGAVRGNNKFFPPDMVKALVIGAKTHRDKLLWLLLAYGGPRVSEALNMWVEDMQSPGETQDGKGRIWLYHPQDGIHKIRGAAGSILKKKRIEVLKERYGLKPRSDNPKERVGWKGMAISDTEYQRSEVYLPAIPVLQQWFWNTYTQYMTIERDPGVDYGHPYLWVNLKGRYKGQPMKTLCVKNNFEAAIRRIGLSGYGPHSLRHHYGHLLAASGQIPIDQAQRYLRHKSIQSTQVYYNKTAEQLRESFNQAWSTLTAEDNPTLIGDSDALLLGDGE